MTEEIRLARKILVSIIDWASNMCGDVSGEIAQVERSGTSILGRSEKFSVQAAMILFVERAFRPYSIIGEDMRCCNCYFEQVD
jgi:hypothetical protein